MIKYLKKKSGLIKEAGQNLLEEYRTRLSRKKAIRNTNIIRKVKGSRVVDARVLREIKKYSLSAFGSASYWPWLVLYSEIRGEFIPGWIPQDYYRFHLLPRYNSELAIQVSETKTLDYFFFPDFALEPMFTKISGQYYSSTGDLLARQEVQRIVLDAGCDIVVKESDGWQGKNIQILSPDRFSIEEMPAKNAVIQPFFQQHPAIARVHPSSVNTLRVFTYMEGDGRARVLFVCLRFGMNGIRVDNVSSGGGYCFIGSDGRCDEFYYNSFGLKGGTAHPDTDVELKTVQIPGIASIRDQCVQCHNKFPYARFIGWDVTVSANEEPVLLEWNTYIPSIWMSEANIGPLWDEIPV